MKLYEMEFGKVRGSRMYHRTYRFLIATPYEISHDEWLRKYDNNDDIYYAVYETGINMDDNSSLIYEVWLPEDVIKIMATAERIELIG